MLVTCKIFFWDSCLMAFMLFKFKLHVSLSCLFYHLQLLITNKTVEDQSWGIVPYPIGWKKLFCIKLGNLVCLTILLTITNNTAHPISIKPWIPLCQVLTYPEKYAINRFFFKLPVLWIIWMVINKISFIYCSLTIVNCNFMHANKYMAIRAVNDKLTFDSILKDELHFEL